MDTGLTDQQTAIDDAVRKIAAHFDDRYWTECDAYARFPEEYYAALAAKGWLGIAMPEEVGTLGLASPRPPS